MKSITYVIKVIVMAISIALNTPAAAEDNYGDMIIYPGWVSRVYDGDTFYVNFPGVMAIFGEGIPVRINGIDAPERRTSCAKEKQHAAAAKEMLEHMLSEATYVELRNMKRGKYFRIVADVYVDGKSVAKSLIDYELARPYGGGKRKDWYCEDKSK